MSTADDTRRRDREVNRQSDVALAKAQDSYSREAFENDGSGGQGICEARRTSRSASPSPMSTGAGGWSVYCDPRAHVAPAPPAAASAESVIPPGEAHPFAGQAAIRDELETVADCARDLAAELVDAGALHLADETTIAQLERQVAAEREAHRFTRQQRDDAQGELAMYHARDLRESWAWLREATGGTTE